MTKTRRLAGAGAFALAIALVGVACSSSSSSSGSSGGGFDGAALTGAGATFPDPIYEQWFKDFQQVEPGAKINYQAIGSGGGVDAFTTQTVDFGASDAPLQADEIKALPAPYIELPTVLGGVVIAYNVSGLDSGLKLDGDTASKIFLGDIKNWDDQSIAAISKAGGGLTFPIKPTTNILNSSATGAYPIATTTYLLLYKDGTDVNKTQTIFDFVTWALTKGQATVQQLNYSPLPSDIAS